MLFEVHVLAACRVSVMHEYEAEASTPEEAATQSKKWFKGHWVRVNEKGAYKFLLLKMLSDRQVERVF